MLIDKARQKLRNVAKQLCMGQRRGRPFSVLTLHKFVYRQKVKLHTFLPSHWDNKIILKTWAMILFRVATIFFLPNFFFHLNHQKKFVWWPVYHFQVIWSRSFAGFFCPDITIFPTATMLLRNIFFSFPWLLSLNYIKVSAMKESFSRCGGVIVPRTSPICQMCEITSSSVFIACARWHYSLTFGLFPYNTVTTEAHREKYLAIFTVPSVDKRRYGEQGTQRSEVARPK